MSTTVTRAGSTVDAEHGEMTKRAGCTRAQRGKSPRCTPEPLDEVRASYDIDPGDTVEAIVCALILAPLSVALVALGALVRMATR